MIAGSPAAGRAPGPARIGAWRKVFSFPVAVAGLLAVLVVLTARSRFDDPDLWWHLKTGEIVWTTHAIPTTDVFSYTANHHIWIPHEWLSETLIYGAYRLGGYAGLMFWLCLFASALLIVGYALCSLYSENAKVGLLGALAIWLFATSGFSIRPQMPGFLLLIVELLLTHLGRTRSPRWFLWLPPLFAVWVNSHASFLVGLIVAGVYLFSSFFHFRVGALVAQRWDPRRRRMLALALILSVAALFVNPVGVRQILYPLTTALHPPLALSQVQEWQPLQFSDPRAAAFLGILGCILFLPAILRGAELHWDEFLLLAMGAWLAAGHQRMLFVFGILAAPTFSRLLAGSWDGYNPAQDRPPVNAALLLTSLAIMAAAFPSRRNLIGQVSEQSPVRAVEFIKARHLRGPMLNDYVFGGYLIWAAPEYPVFVAGNADVFEWTGAGEEFGRWATLQSDPNALLEKYGINFCLLARGSPMVRVLPLLPHWKSIYSDADSAIFERSPVW